MMTSLNVIMTDRVVTVKPQTTLRELVGILRVLVMQNDELRGIVSATDIVRAVALDLL